MAIFSRRTLQRLINENVEFLTKKQTKKLVNKLNRGDLSAEWEVVLLNAFSKIGKVIHEPKFQESKKEIDIHFTSKDINEVSFLADITSISDEGKDNQYPYDIFEDRLWSMLIGFNVKGGWSYEIGISNNQSNDEGLPTLKLPAIAHFERDIFNEEFSIFLNKVKENPQNNHEYKIQNVSTELTIIYKPSDTWWISGGNRINYKINTHKKVFDVLYEKYNQLIDTKFQGNLGIILCDRDSKKINETFCSYPTKSLRNIIETFLETYPEIGFVLVVVADWQVGQERKNQITIKLFKGICFDERLDEILLSLPKMFPTPVFDAINAQNYLKSVSSTHQFSGASFRGGLKGGENYVKISSRTLLDLISGHISWEVFEDSHGKEFSYFRNQNRLIRSTRIEHEPEKDDDWIVFVFGEPDVAISPFKVPDTYK